MTRVIDSHYRRLAPLYERFLSYSGGFVRSLTSRMIERLALKPDDRLVDLGCGTGMYAVDILHQMPLRHPIACVEPCEEMLARLPRSEQLAPINVDAQSFCRAEVRYEKLLMKETIHHIAGKQEFLLNLYGQLTRGGVALFVHVPPKLDYPLFQEALARCERWHADSAHLARLLEGAGFETDLDTLEYRHSVPKDLYFEMVEGRYMSVLSTFSDDQLREGLAEMERRCEGRSMLEFVDRFDFIRAAKPEGTFR